MEDWELREVERIKRIKRRQHDALLDNGHLRAHYAHQNWPHPDAQTYNQLIRAYRHSCHAGCCRWSYYVKRADRRQDRHQVRMMLAKHWSAERRRINYFSEASYKGL